MLKKLRLKNFKNFKDAELGLGPFTVLVGANATGKSNIRDAFRFLHGISRGYSLSEIIGEKYADGVLQWRGIRGGAQEISYQGNPFSLEIEFTFNYEEQELVGTYFIEVSPGIKGFPPVLLEEWLKCEGYEYPIFHAVRGSQSQDIIELQFYDFSSKHPDEKSPWGISFARYTPVFSQLRDSDSLRENLERSEAVKIVRTAIKQLNQFRFLELNPDAMKKSSLPGQKLGERGENLASALYEIYTNKNGKDTLLFWLQELTPMDASDLEFPVDLAGKVTLQIVERTGEKISISSASDGTLRLLGLLAVLINLEEAGFYFFEELETGIHPNRLYLLIQLIESHISKQTVQVVSTTHSPQFLRFLSTKTLEYTSLTYRNPNQSYAHIRRILDLPDARRIVAEQDIAELHDSGWMEDVVFFADAEAPEVAPA